MGTLNEFLAEKRDAVRSLRAAARANPQAKAFQASCRVLGRSGVREVRIRDYQVITDTPPYFAGYALGPSAPELMLGAFASCLAHTAVIIAADQGLSLDSLDVEVIGDMDPFAQTPGHEHIPIAPHNIRYRLHVASTETAERISALNLEVQRRCSLFNLIRDAQEIGGEIVQAAPAPIPAAKPVGTRLKIGIIGAGFIGRAIASHAVKHGHEVMISNSRGPGTLGSTIVAIGCRAGTVEEAAEFGDVVAVAIPFRNIGTLPAGKLAGKVVLDANNYYPHRDGAISALDREETTTSEILAERLPGARVVKAFNAILQSDLAEGGTPAGSPGRRALPIAGDDADAKRLAAELLDQFGYDTVDAGPLSEGWRFQRAMPAYCVPLDSAELKRALAAAQRGVELPHGSWRRVAKP